MQNISVEKIDKAGNYLRLSTDSDYTGSDSLENQRKLAKEFANNISDVVIIKEYVDDGKTGTNFERPAFARMIEDLKQGIINCVIVKDLSRFGREYIEAGNYIEKVFPFLGVRFISIVDRYDSKDSGSDRELLLLSLKNLMHEMYAKDISKKIGSTFQMKWEKKKFYRATKVPYGYQMDDKNENYCIDEAAASIVREIFLQYSQRASCYAIRSWLYEHRIVNPTQYSQTGSIVQRDEDVLKIWHLSTIQRMLENSVYIGNVRMHKTSQSLFEGKKSSAVPEDEQVLLIGNHPPIIDEELFHLVQRKRQQAKEKIIENRMNSDIVNAEDLSVENIVEGKIFCGDCKVSMYRNNACRFVQRKKERYKVFNCRRHFYYKSECDFRGIEETVLYEIILITIHKQIALIKGYKGQMEKSLQQIFDHKMQEIEQEKDKLQNQKILLIQEYMQVYGEYTERKVSKEQFQDFRKDYREKADVLDKQLERQKEKEKQGKKCLAELRKTAMRLLKFDHEKKLTRDMVESCIERIDVFSNNRLHIKLNYQDCFRMLDDWMKGGKEKG
jgi:hypothetical protein